MNAFPIRIARDPRLVLRGRAVEGPLHLLPLHENGLTFAFGFALSTVPRLVDHLLARVGVRTRSSPNALRIVLQDRSERDGITDVEIQEADGSVLALLEAKASGWPGLPQLSKYARRKGVVPGRTVIIALGVPPATPALAQKSFLQVRGRRVRLRVLRWVDILSMVNDLRRRTDGLHGPVLEQLQSLIEEVIGMQSYDREVAIRDVGYGSRYYGWFMENNLACSQPSDKTEPLFYAPCFSRVPYPHLGGIHYFGRIYFRGVLARGRRGNRQALLNDAQKVIDSVVARLKSKKTARDQRAYLKRLPEKWAQGLRQIASSKRTGAVAVAFLGDPIRLPRPLRKIGRQIPPGFSMTLESILSSEAGTFRC